MKVIPERMIEQLSGESCYLWLNPEHLEVAKWTKQARLDCLEKGSNKKRFQNCLDSCGYLLHMRAMQGHSGGDCSSVVKSGLIAGGKDSKE